MSRKTPPCGDPSSLLDLGVDGARDVVAGRQLGRAARVGLATLGQRGDPAGRLLVGGGVLGAPVLGEVVPHEPVAVDVAQDPALAADGLRDEEAAHARRPDHPGRVELDELHVDQLGAGLVGERLAVAAVLPRVRGDLVRLPDPAGGEHDRLGRKDDRLAGRPPVAEGTGHPVRTGHQPRDGGLHVDLDAERDRAILEGPDHLEPGPVADMGEARVRVTTERALEDPAVGRPVEDRAPQLELADPLRGLGGVEPDHLRVVEELAADHRVAEVDLPRIGRRDVAERRGHAAFGHHGVGLAEERLADETDIGAGHLGLDGGAQTGAAGADDEDVVRADLRFRRWCEGHRSRC